MERKKKRIAKRNEKKEKVFNKIDKNTTLDPQKK